MNTFLQMMYVLPCTVFIVFRVIHMFSRVDKLKFELLLIFPFHSPTWPKTSYFDCPGLEKHVCVLPKMAQHLSMGCFWYWNSAPVKCWAAIPQATCGQVCHCFLKKAVMFFFKQLALLYNVWSYQASYILYIRCLQSKGWNYFGWQAPTRIWCPVNTVYCTIQDLIKRTTQHSTQNISAIYWPLHTLA